MDLRIKGKIAFVAGGSKGMGESASTFLAEAGCRVAVVARDQVAIDRMVERLRTAGGTAIGISADLTTKEGVKAAVDTVRDTWGPPQIVLGQTNDLTSGRFFERSDDDFRRVFEIFTMGFLMLAREVIPDMRKAKWGRIVHLSSCVAKEPDIEPHIVHNTVRASTTNLIKSLADEFARDGITVNSIAPGYIMTDTMREFVTKYYGADADIENWVKNTRNIPAERHGTPEEIGSLVAYLCSDLAGYITGEYINVDGGWHRAAV
jgi:3-oxoacyl-[acyl-carrier protein] reductase